MSRLTNSYLSNIVASESYFNRSNSNGSNLKSVNCSHVPFWKSNLSNTTISDSKFRASNLGFANLCKSNINTTDLTKTDLTYATPLTAIRSLSGFCESKTSAITSNLNCH